MWRSRSGATPSNARAPSNTTEPSHAACVRGPMIGTLPSCHLPSKKVQLGEYSIGFLISAMTGLPWRDAAIWQDYWAQSLNDSLREPSLEGTSRRNKSKPDIVLGT